MRYKIRYYLNGDKTRFYESEIEVDLASSSFEFAVADFLSRIEGATVQNIVKL